jgi:hypothetical protein
MANAGTLLTDLDGKMPIAGDNDLVNMIYKDMNSGPSPGPEMRPGGAIQMMPSSQTPHMNQMDTVPATAHIIGGQHPTAGDFAHMLQSSSTGFAPSAWGPGAQGQAQGQRQMTPEEFAAQVASMQAQQGKAWTGFLMEELKLPLLIAILVFIINMPFVSVLVAHYASWMLKSSGEMNLYGEVFKSFLVAGLFWGANKILLPLLR